LKEIYLVFQILPHLNILCQSGDCARRDMTIDRGYTLPEFTFFVIYSHVMYVNNFHFIAYNKHADSVNMMYSMRSHRDYFRG